jgi:hypothetical protein
MNYSAHQVELLNEVANKYKPIVYAAIHSIISQSRFRNTGAAADSLSVDIVEGSADLAPQLEIRFADYLNILDKKKLQWTKLPDMKKLIEWAETKVSDEKKAKKLAFAVAAIQKNRDTWKARPWRKKSLSDVLKEMNQIVLKAFDEALGKDFEDAVDV